MSSVAAIRKLADCPNLTPSRQTSGCPRGPEERGCDRRQKRIRATALVETEGVADCRQLIISCLLHPPKADSLGESSGSLLCARSRRSVVLSMPTRIYWRKQKRGPMVSPKDGVHEHAITGYWRRIWPNRHGVSQTRTRNSASRALLSYERSLGQCWPYGSMA